MQENADRQKPATQGPFTSPEPRGEIFDFDPSDPTSMNNPSSPRQRPKGWLLVALAAALFIYSLGYFVRSKSRTPEPIGPFVDAANATPALKVQILGAVKNPGVYDVPAGARVQEAIDAAGGTLPEADLSRLNLADWAKDGSKIEVPQVVATAPAVPVQNVPLVAPTAIGATVPSGDGAPTSLPDAAIPNSTLPSSGTSVNASPEYLKQNPLDLNQATAAQLEVLPGVGEKMAARIVDYRTRSGGFRSVNELDNVEGIGEKRLTVLRELVVVR